ncbi:MAG: JAB domain-containing protein [Eubacteriales bacterium]
MLGEEKNRLEYLFQSVTGINKEKCNRVFEKYTVGEVVDNPLLFEGTALQTRKIELLVELQTSIKTKDPFWSRKQICGPKDASDYFESRMTGLDHEEVHMLLLDTRHRVIKAEVMAKGGLASAGMYPRELARTALKYNASAAIIAHNHPSGDSKPSQDDIASTKALQKSFDMIGIELVDHLVVGSNNSTSLKELGVLERGEVYLAPARTESRGRH